MSRYISFGRAVYEGDVNGPKDRVIVDANNRRKIYPQLETSPYAEIPREVTYRIRSVSGVALGKVIDFQHPDTEIVATIDRHPRFVQPTSRPSL